MKERLVKRVFVAIVGMIFWLAVTSAEPTLSVPRDKQIWYTSAPGATDLAGMVSDHTNPRYNWDQVRPYISVMQYYLQHTSPTVYPNVEGNTYNALSRAGFFAKLKELGIVQAIEVPAVKRYACGIETAVLEGVIRDAVESVQQVDRAGGAVRYLTIDSALVGAQECPTGRLMPGDTGYLVAHFMKEVRTRLPERLRSIGIGDVEPYPRFDPEWHKWYLSTVDAASKQLGTPPLEYYHIDIDMKEVKDNAKMAEDVRNIAVHVKKLGKRFGMTINGSDTDSVIEYFQSANSRLALYQLNRLHEAMDNVVFQSWATSSDGRQYLPPNVPSDEPYNHMSFVWHGLNCLFTPSWRCELYPQP